jgi:hypothetical protein
MKLKVVEVTQIRLPYFEMMFQEQDSGIGLKIVIHRSIFDLQKD